ncbi:exocyst complex component exo84 [Mortierella sp. AD094]|nr:exocyst complex component exo84 [Mortierella sp. AD094]
MMLSQMTLTAAKLEKTRKRLDERVSRLSRAIIVELGQPHITKVAVQRNVGWLERLGCLDQARDVFLSNRTKVARQRISQVRSKKDPILHVEELAMIVFTSIKNTSEWFELSFKDPKMSSAVVKWAKQEIEYFGDIYKNIVFGHEMNNFQVIADCAKIATEQCNKLYSRIVDSVAILFKAYVNRTIQVYEEQGMADGQFYIQSDSAAEGNVCTKQCSTG